MSQIKVISLPNERRKKRVSKKEISKRKLPAWMENDRVKKFIKRDKVCQCQKKQK